MIVSDKIPSSVNMLMIVAHPDDETIWGGQHLLSDRWLVVCVTYNVWDEPRGKEFCSVMSITNNIGMMLGFPDEISGKSCKWELSCKEEIKAQLYEIITLKPWARIVTHNPDGEYFHKHHIIISNIVTSITTDNLYYFGKYYKRSDDALNTLRRLDEKWVNEKRKLMSYYKSQGISANAFEYMYPYEHFIPYKEWHNYQTPIFRNCINTIFSTIVSFFEKVKWHLTHR